MPPGLGGEKMRHVGAPYHAGELSVQHRAGVRDKADRLAGMVMPGIGERPAAFLASQPFLVVGAVDRQGRPWASVLTGPPGFVTAADEQTVRISTAMPAGDPWLDGVRVGAPVALLAIDLGQRRRLRLNGTVVAQQRDSDRVRLAVRTEQVYPNCAKYIEAREVTGPGAPRQAIGVQLAGAELTPGQQLLLRRADAFFIATTGPDRRADVSHRGGRPGFLTVADARHVSWPDYVGNNMFNTLGNLAVHPRTGLLVVDFDSGDLVQLTGTAVVDWDAGRAADVPGAQRLVHATVQHVVHTPAALPLRFTAAHPSPPAARLDP